MKQTCFIFTGNRSGIMSFPQLIDFAYFEESCSVGRNMAASEHIRTENYLLFTYCNVGAKKENMTHSINNNY